jgi:hypothetical protein
MITLTNGGNIMAQVAVNTNEIKHNYSSEMQRRQKERQAKQDFADVAELNRRSCAVRDGTERVYTEEESEVILKEIGFYD